MNTITTDSDSSVTSTSAFPFTSISTPSRTGKIARLPKLTRDDLNERLCDGVPGKEIVSWLNGLSEVQRVMKDQFQGQMITEQNLSAWRHGGYLDWVAHEERRDWVERMAEEGEDLRDDAGAMPLMERIGTRMELVLGRAVEQMLRGPMDLESPQVMKQLLALSKEVARHRKLGMEAAKRRDEKQQREEDEELAQERPRRTVARKSAGTHAKAKAKRVAAESDWLTDELADELGEPLPGEEADSDHPLGKMLRALFRKASVEGE